MSSLIIKSKIGLERFYSSKAKSKCTFKALPDHPTDNLDDIFSDTKLTFDKAEKLHTGHHTTVFRGELAAEDGSMDPLDVVIKIDISESHAKSLIREAKWYTTKLNDLQGDTIPLYYGLYQAKFASRNVTCIVLQYCGEPINNYFDRLDRKFQMAILNRLSFLHQLGVTHGDFREPNVLDNNGVPFIVDFEHAANHHCHCVRSLVVWGSLKPYPSEFKCQELWNFASRLGVWMSSAFEFHTALVVVRKLKSVDQLVEMVPDRFKATEAACQRIRKEAHEVFKSLVNHSQFHPDVPLKPLLSTPVLSPPFPPSLNSGDDE